MRGRTQRLVVGLLGLLAPALAPFAAPTTVAPHQATLEECDARARDHPGDFDAWWCFQESAGRTGRRRDAMRMLASRLALDPSNCRARVVLGTIETWEGGGEATLKLAADAAIAAADRQAEAAARLSLAYILDQSGRAAAAGPELERAAALADALGDASLRARAMASYGLHDLMQGDYGKSWTEYKKAEELAFPDGPEDLRANILNGLGSVCGYTGRDQEAREYYRRQADILHSIPDLNQEAFPRYNVAFLAEKSAGSDWAPVRALYLDALDAAVRGRNLGVESSARMKLARDPDPALTTSERIRHVERALAIARQTGQKHAIGPALRQLAVFRYDADPGHPEKAFEVLREAINRARAGADREELARDLIMKAEIRRNAGPRDLARTESLEALEAVERVRDLQQDDLIRARVHSQYVHAYLRFSGFLLQTLEAAGSPDDLDLAFRVVEQMRGRALLEALDSAAATTASTDLPAAFADRRTALLRDLAAVQKKLMNPGVPPAERARALVELERLEAGELGLRDELARSSPEFASVRRPSIASLSEVRGRLAEDEGLISFQLWNHVLRAGDVRANFGSWIIAVTRDGARAFPIPDRDIIEERVSFFLALLERRDGREGDAAAQLYHDLLEPALASLPPAIRRLVIVPDGPLNSLPFDALRLAPDAPPLGARYEIALAPSASLWVRLRDSAPDASPRPALALADPAIVEDKASAGSDRSATLTLGVRLPALPRSREEARAVIRSLGPPSRFLAGADASERFLKTAALQDYGVLHIAAHAVVDDAHPERTAVVLAPGAADEDGLLQVREIVRLDLRNQLVILSACRSASGAVLPGEGVLGLSRGFFQAGARAVIGSLWTLRDEEAAALVPELARGLAAGQSIGSALATARRARLAAGAPARAWAGLVVLGDADAVPVPGGRPAPRLDPRAAAIMALAALALVGALALGAKALRRRRQAAG